MIVVDTNAVSEMMRADASPTVVRWFTSGDPNRMFTTSVTVAEIEFGIESLPGGARRAQLRAAADAMFSAFSDRLLAFDAAAAKHYGRVMTGRRRAGQPTSVLDAQIASICLSHSAALATRNVKDFESVGVALVNPWQPE